MVLQVPTGVAGIPVQNLEQKFLVKVLDLEDHGT